MIIQESGVRYHHNYIYRILRRWGFRQKVPRKVHVNTASAEEKERNKSHSRKRIVVEHTICRVKKHRIMGDIFRNRLRNYDKVSEIVSGLVDYRTLASSF
jgi:hypothetical protein